jgi:drebrin-like protein
MAALRAQKSDTTSGLTSYSPPSPEVVKGGYVPVGKVDIAAIRAQAKESSTQQEPSRPESYVGTSGYTPVQLSKPKPLASRFGGGTGFGGPRVRGTVAPMPVAPVRESKVVGGASKNFAVDASGKTPSQLWAERKARERGLSPGSTVPSVVPDIAPQSPLPRASPTTTTSAPTASYVEDSSDVIGKPVSGGVAAMRERFARQSLEEGEQPSLPISPGTTRPPPRVSPAFAKSSAPLSAPTAPTPPPVAMSSKPPPKTYQSLDDVVAAGAGAGVGLGVAALAGIPAHHEEEEPEEEFTQLSTSDAPPPLPPQKETWDTAQPAEAEDEEDIAARQRSQIHAEQEYEPEPEPEPEAIVHEEREVPAHVETGAQSAKTAIVLFDYEAQEENEISLAEGQVITNIEFLDEVNFPPLPYW